MKRNAFIMKIKPGSEAEYEKRHQEVYPELLAHLTDCGIKDYSIFLDRETSTLFAYQLLDDGYDPQKVLSNPIVWKWWNFMSDIMEVNEDKSPWERSLYEVFHLD